MSIYQADENDSALFRGFVEANRLLGAAENLVSELAVDLQPPERGFVVHDLSNDLGELREKIQDALVAAMSGPDRAKVEEQFRRWAN